jgi:hypothetical protein
MRSVSKINFLFFFSPGEKKAQAAAKSQESSIKASRESITHTIDGPDALEAFCFAIFDNSRSSLALSLSGPFVSSPAFPETSCKSKTTNDQTD